MIRTVQQLREALHDAPDDMPLRTMINRGILVGVDSVAWIEGRCVIVAASLNIESKKPPTKVGE